MNQRKSREVHFGAAGDTTTGPISLTDMTTVDQDFYNLIGVLKPPEVSSSSLPPSPVPSLQQLPASHQTFEVDQTSIQQNPEEIAKQLRLNQSRPIGGSAKVIETLRKENLDLKVKLYNANKTIKQFQESGGTNLKDSYIEGKQDLVADLLNKNKQLEKQLEERDRRDEEKRKSTHRDRECQTNLDSSNIVELLKDRIALKRIMEQRSTTNHNVPHQHIAPNKMTASNKQLRPDEKELLERLFWVDGTFTTILDKLKTMSDNH